MVRSISASPPWLHNFIVLLEIIPRPFRLSVRESPRNSDRESEKPSRKTASSNFQNSHDPSQGFRNPSSMRRESKEGKILWNKIIKL